MNNKIHFAQTFRAGYELLNHFDITVDAFVKMHAGEDIVRIFDGMSDHLWGNWTHVSHLFSKS